MACSPSAGRNCGGRILESGGQRWSSASRPWRHPGDPPATGRSGGCAVRRGRPCDGVGFLRRCPGAAQRRQLVAASNSGGAGGGGGARRYAGRARRTAEGLGCAAFKGVRTRGDRGAHAKNSGGGGGAAVSAMDTVASRAPLGFAGPGKRAAGPAHNGEAGRIGGPCWAGGGKRERAKQG